MTQVLLHDYGKGRFTLKEIRAAIKAVKSERSSSEVFVGKVTSKAKTGAVGRNK